MNYISLDIRMNERMNKRMRARLNFRTNQHTYVLCALIKYCEQSLHIS